MTLAKPSLTSLTFLQSEAEVVHCEGLVISFEHQERVHAPVEDAFEFGLNPDNWLRHFSDMEEYEIVDDTGDEMVVRVP